MRDHKVVLVTCDIIAFRWSFTNRVTERVKANMDCRARIRLFASHNHAGPALVQPRPGELPAQTLRPARGSKTTLSTRSTWRTRSLSWSARRLERCSRQACPTASAAPLCPEPAEPAAQGIKLGKNPAGPTDESVPILQVRDVGDKPLAIVFGYACHNTTLRPDMMQIAADFAGFAQDRIEADYPVLSVSVTGCAGDADPHPFGTLKMAEDHGQELG